MFGMIMIMCITNREDRVRRDNVKYNFGDGFTREKTKS